MSPESGGVVMATGIVSVSLRLEHAEFLSGVLLVLTAVSWGLLGFTVVVRASEVPARWRSAARRPAALTAVAGTAVLGTRLALLGWTWAGWSLLALAVILWLALAPFSSIGRRASGASFLTAVAPQSLAVLAALLAQRTGLLWPAIASVAPFSLGIAAYAVTLARFDFKAAANGTRRPMDRGRGARDLYARMRRDGPRLIAHRAWGGEPLRIGTIVLWALSVAWLPPLLFTELRWPRLGYNLARWGTVFPLGTYAVMSATAGEVASLRLLIDLGRAMAWIAFAAWCVVAAGAARRAPALARRALARGSRD